jgi:hypothetical protein
MQHESKAIHSLRKASHIPVLEHYPGSTFVLCYIM